MTYIFVFLVCIGAAITFWVIRGRQQAAIAENQAQENGPAEIARNYFWTSKLPALGIYAVLGVIAFIMLLNTSVVNPSGNQFAQFDRTYFCSSIKDGRNVALPGECGRQAGITMPGFHFSIFVGVLNSITYKDMLDVPDGHYATLSARDGLKLDEGQVAAQPWPLGTATFTNSKGEIVTGNMLDAVFFLTDGQGRKGPQATILPPGRHAVNDYLWDVQVDTLAAKAPGDATKNMTTNFLRRTIPTGYIGVVKSAINEDRRPSFIDKNMASTDCSVTYVSPDPKSKQIKAILVPVGCRGVWKDGLWPGDYFFNKSVYQVEDHDTRLQNLVLAGGYLRRYIDLTVGDDGTMKQTPSQTQIEVPTGAVGPAVAVKVEGWTVYQELRIQFRTKPEYAPLQAAAVGTLKEVEDRIIIPQAISALRNIGGSNITVKNTTAYEEAKSELNALNARLEVLKDMTTDVGLNPEQRKQELAALERQVAGFKLPDPNQEVTRPTRVLDFQNERQALETLVATAISEIGQEAGVEIVSVTFGNVDIPPELLVARKVEQLSGQLRNAYTQMRTAQVQRQATESARARADQQNKLVTAQIGVETSKLGIEQRGNEGLAEQKFLEANALGQKAQTEVLGANKVMLLRIADKFIEAVKEKPEIINAIRWPGTVVFGSSGLDGAAAIMKGAFATGTAVQR